MKPWKIDMSTGREILVYQDCSVIEGDEARYLLSLIEADQARRGIKPGRLLSFWHALGLTACRGTYYCDICGKVQR
jgi:hypothetical protein